MLKNIVSDFKTNCCGNFFSSPMRNSFRSRGKVQFRCQVLSECQFIEYVPKYTLHIPQCPVWCVCFLKQYNFSVRQRSRISGTCFRYCAKRMQKKKGRHRKRKDCIIFVCVFVIRIIISIDIFHTNFDTGIDANFNLIFF